MLSDEIVATPVPTNGEYKRPFQVSEMFDFKYKEDVEECYQLIRKRKKARTDKSMIDVDSEDFMIDLSPCIGIYQKQASLKTMILMHRFGMQWILLTTDRL